MIPPSDPRSQTDVHRLARFASALPVAVLIRGLVTAPVTAQTPARTYTHADTLRGTNGPARAWWDVEYYDLHTTVTPEDSSVRGYNAITYRVLRPSAEMQIDLQVPMEADSMVQDGKRLTYRRDGNAFFVALTTAQQRGSRRA